MAVLDNLKILVSADTSGFSKGLSRARNTLGGFRGALAGAVSVGGLAAFVKSSLDAADALAKVSRNTGFTVERMQELRFGADLSGVSTEQLSSNLTAFVKRVGEAKAGTGPLVSFLKKYDKQLLKNIQNSKSQNEALGLISEAIGKAGSAADRAAIANAAFSRAGIKMVDMLKNGKQGLADLSAEARKNSTIMTTEAAQGAEAANDALFKLEQGLKSAGQAFAVDFADEIKGFADWAPKALNYVAASIKAIGRTIGATAAFSNQLIQGNFSAAGTIASEAFTDITGAFDGLGDGMVSEQKKSNAALQDISSTLKGGIPARAG